MLSFVLFVDFSVPEVATGKQMKHTITLSKLVDSSAFNVVGNIWDLRTQLNTIDNFSLVILRHLNAELLHIKAFRWTSRLCGATEQQHNFSIRQT